MTSVLSKTAGMTVTDAVADVIRRHYLIYEALKLRIVNYHALASSISKEVDELTGKQASVETIVVAIKRFADALPKERPGEFATIFRDAKLNLSSGAADITVEGKNAPTLEIMEEVLKLGPTFQTGVNVLQLPNSVKILADQDDAVMIKKKLSAKYSLLIKNDVAKISIRISPKAEKVPGIVSFIAELLYRNGISILDAFLGYEDILLIVEKDFGPKAYEVLSKEIAA